MTAMTTMTTTAAPDDVLRLRRELIGRFVGAVRSGCFCAPPLSALDRTGSSGGADSGGGRTSTGNGHRPWAR